MNSEKVLQLVNDVNKGLVSVRNAVDNILTAMSMCDWCEGTIVNPFVTVDDRLMCKECSVEYNREKGW